MSDVKEEEFYALVVELSEAALKREQSAVLRNILMRLMILSVELGLGISDELKGLLEVKPRSVNRSVKERDG